MAREIVPLISRETSEELIRALAYPKFGLNEQEIEVLLGSYLPYSESVKVGVGAPGIYRGAEIESPAQLKKRLLGRPEMDQGS